MIQGFRRTTKLVYITGATVLIALLDINDDVDVDYYYYYY